MARCWPSQQVRRFARGSSEDPIKEHEHLPEGRMLSDYEAVRASVLPLLFWSPLSPASQAEPSQ